MPQIIISKNIYADRLCTRAQKRPNILKILIFKSYSACWFFNSHFNVMQILDTLLNKLTVFKIEVSLFV